MVKAKKNKDFKKIKLKVGKKLTKPNDTRTDFKAKKLILRGQLESKSTDPSVDSQYLSHRKLNIKELCHHLRHHNLNVRKDAVSSLKDIIIRQNRDQIRINLKFLLENLCILITDVELDVRNLFYATVREILDRVQPTDISPSIQLIIAHVVCASTHFNSSIKLFGVKLIGLLLDKVPNLCCRNVTLLKTYADILNFKEKNLNRASKSSILTNLVRLMRISYAVENLDNVSDNCVKNTFCEPSNQVAIINPASCSLTRHIFNPFDFSIYPADFCPGVDITDGGSVDWATFYYVAEKCIPFSHAIWLELTISDEQREKTKETNIPFDLATLLDLQSISEIYQIILGRLKMQQDEFVHGSITGVRDLKRKYFDNEQFLSYYYNVFPCRYRHTSGVDQGRLAEVCRRVNLIMCQLLCRRREYKSKICDFLKNVKTKLPVTLELLSRVDAKSPLCS